MYIKHEYNSLEIWNTKALLSFVHFTFFTSYSYYACRCGELESRVQKGISDLSITNGTRISSIPLCDLNTGMFI